MLQIFIGHMWCLPPHPQLRAVFSAEMAYVVQLSMQSSSSLSLACFPGSQVRRTGFIEVVDGGASGVGGEPPARAGHLSFTASLRFF